MRFPINLWIMTSISLEDISLVGYSKRKWCSSILSQNSLWLQDKHCCFQMKCIRCTNLQYQAFLQQKYLLLCKPYESYSILGRAHSLRVSSKLFIPFQLYICYWKYRSGSIGFPSDLKYPFVGLQAMLGLQAMNVQLQKPGSIRRSTSYCPQNNAAWWQAVPSKTIVLPCLIPSLNLPYFPSYDL